MSRKKLIITAIILALVLAIGGILAYFTDSETIINKFTMGSIDISVIEPSWPGTSDNPVNDITPGAETPKDPQIVNNGTNSVYAFMEVSVPYANITVEGATAAADTPLFTYELNSGWKQVGDVKTVAASGEDKLPQYVYVYAYMNEDDTLKEVLKGETTPSIFDKVKFADIHEEDFASSSIQGKELDVVVTGHGIQTKDLSEEDATLTPAEVWNLIKQKN